MQKGKKDAKEATKAAVSKHISVSSVKSRASSKSSDNIDSSKENWKVKKPVEKDSW